MDNREAIEWLKGCVVAYEVDNKGKPNGNITCELTQEVIDMAISALEKQEKDRWIPVTERLPEDEYVLISKKPAKLSGSKWSVAIAIRTADPRSRKIQWRDSGFAVIQDDMVFAWRPLPEAF